MFSLKSVDEGFQANISFAILFPKYHIRRPPAQVWWRTLYEKNGLSAEFKEDESYEKIADRLIRHTPFCPYTCG